MRNGGKKAEPYGPAYRDLIQLRRDDLRDKAAGALQMQGIDESERENIERALKLLGSIDALVKILDKHPSHVQQARALVHLWKVIGAGFIIGSHGIKSPITDKFRTAHARNGRPRIRDHDQIQEVIDRHCDPLWKKKPTYAGNQLGTAKAIREGVNAELATLRIDPLGLHALAKKIVLLGKKKLQRAGAQPGPGK